MSFMSFLGGVGRELNPFDNGATYSNPSGNGGDRSAASQIKSGAWSFLKAAAKPAVAVGADVSNAVGNAEVGTAHALGLAKDVKTQSNEEQFGKTVGDYVGKNTPRQFLGNAAQLALMVAAPGIGGVADTAATGVVGAVAPGIAENITREAALKAALGYGANEIIPAGVQKVISLIAAPVAGALFGSGQNVASDVADNNKHLTPGSELRSAVKGGEVGAAFGAGGEALNLGAQSLVKNATNLNEVGAVGRNVNQADQVAKAGSVEEVKAILKDQVPKETLDQIAPALVKATDSNVVNNILDKVTNPAADQTPLTDTAARVPRANIPSFAGKIDPVTASKTEDVIKEAENTPRPPGTTRVFQANVPGSQTPWVFDNVDSLKEYQNLRTTADHTFSFQDVPTNDLVPTANGEHVFKIAAPENGGPSPLQVNNNTGAPLVGQDVHGAAQQAYLGKQAAADVTQAPSIVPQEAAPVAAPVAAAADVAKGPSIVPPVNPDQQLAESVAAKLRGNPASKGESPIAGLSSLQRKQAALNAAERSQQTARATVAGQGLEGEAKLNAIREAQKGTFAKVDTKALVESVQKAVPESDYNKISNQLVNNSDFSIHEQANAAEAWKNFYRNGKLPTPYESSLLDKALGPNFTSSIEDHASTIPQGLRDKVSSVAAKVAATPKSIMASMDLSGAGRQGSALGARFPAEFKDALVEQAKYFGSEDHYNTSMAEIASRPNADLYAKMKLALTGVQDATKPEEQFVGSYAESNFAKKLGIGPITIGNGVEASDRAYTGVLTKLRADAADHIIGDLDKAGITASDLGQKQLEDIGRFINTASGRGDLGSLEKHATSLQSALFSPRLWKSRLDMLNPLYYAKLDPIARKYALQSAASFAGVATAVMGLAKLAGADVGADPRSSDFGKIKVGNTRYDILGGFQQNIRVAAQLLTGEKIDTANGSVKKLSGGFGTSSRWNVLEQFGLNKANPIISSTQKLLSGKTPAGDAVNPLTTIGNLFVPLSFQDAYQGYKDTGVGGVAKTLPGLFGVGVQNYQVNISTTQKKYIDALTKKGATPEEIKATTQFFQQIKKAPAPDQTKTKIEGLLKSGDKEGAVSAANDYNKQYSASFKEWANQYGKQYGSKDLTQLYNRGKISNVDIARMVSKIQKDKVNTAKGVVKL